MSQTTIAWLVLIFGFLLPLAHVTFGRHGIPWRAPSGSRCPFGPRLGWVVIVLITGIFGWLMFMSARRKRHTTARQ